MFVFMYACNANDAMRYSCLKVAACFLSRSNCHLVTAKHMRRLSKAMKTYCRYLRNTNGYPRNENFIS